MNEDSFVILEVSKKKMQSVKNYDLNFQRNFNKNINDLSIQRTTLNNIRPLKSGKRLQTMETSQESLRRDDRNVC